MGRFTSSRHVAIVGLTGVMLVAGSPALAADPQPYGHNDGGGFRNILPPGSNGLDSLTDFRSYLATGSVPRWWDNQQPLYAGLLQAAPTLTDGAVNRFFKDATFGVRAGDRTEVIKPRPGVTIVRDKRWGVPRIYGTTRRDTTFGAGYAGAADRLFLMDVLRHTGRAELSSFLGGSNLSADEDQWRFAAYSDADLRRQIRMMSGTASGRRAIGELRSYTRGVNSYIRDARRDPDLMPAEYSLLGKQVRDWRQTDVIATASLVGGIFGRGGGASVQAAEVYTALRRKFGTDRARAIWRGFRSKNDPQAPVTTRRKFPYMTGDAFAPRGLALPDPGSVTDAPVVTDAGVSSAAVSELPRSDFAEGLADLRSDRHASNWEIVPGRHTTTGRPLAVMGPQVGYWLPQILVEQELHGPGIEARGVAFAGVNLYVQMGHGRDYAWSATSAGSDNTDVFAEVLCGGSNHRYRYKGKCRPMDKLVRRNSWTPNAIDPSPAGSATLTTYRTVHGLVQSYGRVGGKRVAFVLARTTYMHEAESAIGFSALNDPGQVRGPRSFQRAASGISFTFNWAYADHDDIAYFLSGAYPQRAPRTSPDFPVLGTGRYDWRGWKPRTWSADLIPFSAHPRDVNPRLLVSWNNKPATGWAAADDQWGFGPIYRSQMIERRVERAIRNGKVSRSELVQAMALPATQDIRGFALLPRLLDGVGSPDDPALAEAVTLLREWRAAGSHRRDLDGDGTYEHTRAIEIMDAWWPRLVEDQFRPGLGATAYEEIQTIMGTGAVTEGERPRAPGFADGWWGYVDRDLSAVLDGRTDRAMGREFCGDGDRRACRELLRDTLTEALAVTPAQLYGQGACADDPQPACFDRNRYRITAAIGTPSSFPFQNRPTFQQVVSVRSRVPRVDSRPGRG